MSTRPTSDHVATAIVIAAWRLGEDPLQVPDGVIKSSRARWHAFAGLLAAFVDVDREYAAQACGFKRGKPARLAYRNLKANVGRMKWYDSAVVREIAATIASNAVEKTEVAPSVNRIPETQTESDVMHPAGDIRRSVPEMRPASAPPKSGRVSLHAGRSIFPSSIKPRAEVAEREPNPNRFSGFADQRPRIAPGTESKSDLARMLAEAVKNTAKLQEKAR